MKLLFIYDGVLYFDEKGNYYGRSYSALPEKYSVMADDITFIMRTAPLDDPAGFSLLPPSVRVVSIPKVSDPKHYFSHLIEAMRVIRAEAKQADMAIVRVPSPFILPVGRVFRRLGLPYMLEVVGCPWDGLIHHSLIGALIAPIETYKLKRGAWLAPYASYVTKEFLQRRYPTKGFSVGVSDVELPPTDESVLAQRLEKLRSHPETLHIGTAAGISVAYKGHRFVVRALALLKAQGKANYIYHMAGSGDPDELQSLADRLGVGDQVVFEGSLPHDRMFAWLDSLDLYVQPSLQEGLPRSVVEAMSRGLPSFGSDVGGMPEILGRECIFPAKNPAAIAAMLSALTEEVMEALAVRNFRRAGDFDPDRLAKERNDFYAAFLAREFPDRQK